MYLQLKLSETNSKCVSLFGYQLMLSSKMCIACLPTKNLLSNSIKFIHFIFQHMFCVFCANLQLNELRKWWFKVLKLWKIWNSTKYQIKSNTKPNMLGHSKRNMTNLSKQMRRSKHFNRIQCRMHDTQHSTRFIWSDVSMPAIHCY